MYTYSIVPGLGKQKRERENTVNMRERKCGRNTKRHSASTHRELKQEGRPVEFLL